MKNLFLLTIISAVAITLNSCMCGCDFKRELACKVFTVKLRINDSIINQTILCSNIDYEVDEQYQISINEFTEKFKSDSTILLSRDSIYKRHLAPNLDCGEDESYEENGWACECYR